MTQIPSLRAACLLLACACCAEIAWGQRPRGPTPRPGNPPAPGVIEGFRDPTQPSPEVREAIEASEVVPDRVGSAAAPPPPVLPQVRMKARLVGSIGPPVAIIEIDGRLLTVYADSETTVANKAGGATTLLIRKITGNELQIELPALKKMLVFH